MCGVAVKRAVNDSATHRDSTYDEPGRARDHAAGP
jgi:hypothetical protein